jgi:TolB-like protein/tetratricopeptide (TPR) repeat protein
MKHRGAFTGLIRELWRRRIPRAGAVYVGASLLALFAADQARDAEVLSSQTFGLLVLVAGLGLPVVLAVAWRSGHGRGTGGPGGPGPDYGTRRAATWALGIVGLAAAGAAALVAWDDLSGREPGGGAPFDTLGIRSRAPDSLTVAVLYLDNETGADSLQYLARGLTEEVIRGLRTLGPIDVIGANAVRAIQRGRVDTATAVAELGIGLLVEGRLEQAGTRRQVAFAVVNARTGDTLSAGTAGGSRGDALALADTLLSRVSDVLRGRTRVTPRGGGATPRGTPRAWVLVRKAEAVVDRVVSRDGTLDGDAVRTALDRADSLLAVAESEAPDWVEPILLRGWLEYRRAELSSEEQGSLEATPLLRGLGHVERALVLRPGDRPAALELRGALRQALVSTMGRGGGRSRMLRLARQDLTEAVEERPILARGWSLLGEVLRREGALRTARRAEERALLEDPYIDEAPDIYYRLFRSDLEAQDYRRAGRWCELGSRRFPADPDLALCRILIMVSVDSVPPDPAAAHAIAREVVDAAAPTDSARLRAYADLQLAKVFARAGRPDSAEAYIRRAHGETLRPWLAYDEAHARLLLGQPDSALDLLAVARRWAPLRAERWPRDAWLRPLWDDPRFRSLVETATD